MTALESLPAWSAHRTCLDRQGCEKYCVFEHGGSVYGVLATAVREVALRPQIATVPDSEPLLAGLCHLRNEFLPVIQLHGLIPGGDPATFGQQVIVISLADGPWGLIVDRVLGLVPLDVHFTPDGGRATGTVHVVMGSATYDHRIAHVLDANAVVRLAADRVNRSWQTANGLSATVSE